MRLDDGANIDAMGINGKRGFNRLRLSKYPKEDQ
jgi:hypothetical protein